jgi:hypothetical protein
MIGGSAQSFGASGTRPGRSPDLQFGRFGDRIGAGKVPGKNAEHEFAPWWHKKGGTEKPNRCADAHVMSGRKVDA